MNKSEVIKYLDKILEDCCEENWDSYGAEPVIQEDYDSAVAFVNALPEDIIIGDGGCPSPDGSISFDWYDGDSIFTVGTTKDCLIYAGSFNIGSELKTSLHGVLPFDGKQVPQLILDNIRRFI